MSELSIRLAKPGDAKPLAVFAERVFRETFDADNDPEDMAAYTSEAFSEERQRSELADASTTTFVVDVGGEIAAYAMVKDHGREIEIARFYVASQFHGKGLAHRLMDAVLALVRERNSERVWLGVWERNYRAIAFYEKFGFRVSGSKPFLLGTDLQTDFVMETLPKR